MNTKGIVINAVGVGFITVGAALGVAKALSRGDIHQVQNEQQFPIIEQVDKFVKSDYNKPDTAELDCYKVDTIKITPEMFNDYQTLGLMLQDNAAAKIKKITTDVKVTPVMGDGSGVGIHTEYKHTPIYLPATSQAIMQNKVYANEKEDKFYVPVEYYSKKNPFVAPKYFRDKD